MKTGRQTEAQRGGAGEQGLCRVDDVKFDTSNGLLWVGACDDLSCLQTSYIDILRVTNLISYP